MNRTEARAAAMKLLYEMEMGGDGGEDTKLNLLEVSPGEDESDYMNQTFEGAKGMLGELDERIQRYCVGWKLERVTRVDLSILRLAVYELLRGEIPAGVVINEAVELSRVYSTDKAGSFINGVLGSMQRDMEAGVAP